MYIHSYVRIYVHCTDLECIGCKMGRGDFPVCMRPRANSYISRQMTTAHVYVM